MRLIFLLVCWWENHYIIPLFLPYKVMLMGTLEVLATIVIALVLVKGAVIFIGSPRRRPLAIPVIKQKS